MPLQRLQLQPALPLAHISSITGHFTTRMARGGCTWAGVRLLRLLSSSKCRFMLLCTCSLACSLKSAARICKGKWNTSRYSSCGAVTWASKLAMSATRISPAPCMLYLSGKIRQVVVMERLRGR
jgi:hypothetical protein